MTMLYATSILQLHFAIIKVSKNRTLNCEIPKKEMVEMREFLSNELKKIESLFSKMNNHFFNGELPNAVLTASPCRTNGRHKTMGWCSVKNIWHEKDKTSYKEINICAEFLTRPIEEVAETVLHEMVHLYNLENDINDTSRNGTYHNKKFKESAESHGLLVEKDNKYGWTNTKLNEEAKSFVNSLNIDFSLYRQKEEKEKAKSKTQSTRKYVCPQCGCIIRATKDVHVICGECEEIFRLEKTKN